MFTAIENALYPVVCDLNAYLSNYVLVFLLIAVGLWYSIRTRFVQVRCFGEGMRRVFGNLTLRGEKHASGMSSFQALATAIAAHHDAFDSRSARTGYNHSKKRYFIQMETRSVDS